MAQLTWQRIPLMARSIISGLLVTFSGLLPWTILFGLNITLAPSIPWSVMVIAIYLFFWNRFVKGSGNGTHAPSRAERYRNTSSHSIATRIYVAGGLTSIGIFLLMMVAYQYFKIPIQELPIKNLSPWIVAIYFAMASFVAGLCEEVGFRGYMQQPLEKSHGVLVAVSISTIVFALLHFNAMLIPFHFLGGINFAIMTWLSHSLRPSIIFHSLTNFLSYILLWQAAILFTDPAYNSLFTWLAGVGLLLIMLAGFWMRANLSKYSKASA